MSKRNAALLLALFAGGFWLTPPAAADPKPGKPAQEQGTAMSASEFEQLWKILQPPNEPWATVAWHSSLTEARTKAQKEKKPLLIRCSYGTLHGLC